jgi:VIT1/CCC1 family predicted Fe2+/Mn2+ transporter
MVIAAASLASLALLGGAAARAGGAPPLKGALRVVLWGAIAMAFTSSIGKLVGAAI